jgi:hypothetical protein
MYLSYLYISPSLHISLSLARAISLALALVLSFSRAPFFLTRSLYISRSLSRSLSHSLSCALSFSLSIYLCHSLTRSLISLVLYMYASLSISLFLSLSRTRCLSFIFRSLYFDVARLRGAGAGLWNVRRVLTTHSYAHSKQQKAWSEELHAGFLAFVAIFCMTANYQIIK